MLHFNIDAEHSDLTSSLNGEEIVWKVLVLDAKSTAIVSSVLRVNDLLRCGITMHTLINSARSPLPDVPVIYLVEPTLDNVNKISQDIKEDKYSSYYINFTSSLNRDLLEVLAKNVAITGKSNKVMQVFDQYLNYIVTEPSLFSLELSNVYYKFSNVKTTEDEINTLAETIANGLFDCIITMGNIPIIRAQPAGPAQLVAEKLDLKLRDYVVGSKFSSGAGSGGSSNGGANDDFQQRLVLILLDRNIDMAAMFSHSWIYQCLVADVFKLERNTIKIEKIEDNKKTKQQYDLDPKDWFWEQNAQLPFPDAVDNADNELKNYKEKAAELTRKHNVLEELNSGKPQTSNLQETVNQLPELTARKAIIDMHMNVLLALLNELKSKNLDSFFEIEQNLNDNKTEQRFLQVLNDGNLHNFEDKLRTFFVLYLTTNNLSNEFLTKVEEVFSKIETDNFNLTFKESFSFIKNLKNSLNLKKSSIIMDNYTKNSNHSNENSNNSAIFSSLSSKLYNLTDGKLTEGVGSLISGLKSLLPEKTEMPITSITKTLMEPNNSTEEKLKITDEYLYFDPKLIRGSHSKQPKRQSYQQSIVFVVGGGNYLEYSNLQEWINSNQSNLNNKSIIYGSTEIYSPSEFLKEIVALGK